ncbi:MAG: dihydroxyacetone kinase subunit DhaK [Treponema sp.]|nr:dihydroxyacetone kinase subunit DhaK [Treponema sp.]
MKKIINNVDNVIDEMVAGLALAYPGYVRRLPIAEPGQAVVVRGTPKTGKVALISGCGSGHEPACSGYVGEGMLDAAVCGAVFTSPGVGPILECIRTVDTGKGVVMIIPNYSGDILNFEMAGEMAEDEGIKTAKIIVNDDVAVMNSTYTVGRRGIAGTILVQKITGGAAEAGLGFDAVREIGERAVANTRSMGIALSACTVPAAGKPGFSLGDDEIEIGLGIHGEPGVIRDKIRAADDLAEHILVDYILKDKPIEHGGEVALLVNGLGATPLMELLIVSRKAHEILGKKGVKVYSTNVGNFMTSLEMAGFSVSVLKLDDELKTFYDAKARTIAWRVCDK